MQGNKYQTELGLSECGIIYTKFIKNNIMGDTQIKVHV